MPSPGRWLASVVRGHQAYYAVPGNSDAVNAFRTQVARDWHQALQVGQQRVEAIRFLPSGSRVLLLAVRGSGYVPWSAIAFRQAGHVHTGGTSTGMRDGPWWLGHL
jgi:hypothetical protein